jgi:osmotically-inducible protein OsmY
MMDSNSDLVSRIVNALLNDPRTGKALIDVSNRGGAVTLTGTAPSHQARQAAETIVLQQEGVVTVVNELSIAGGRGQGSPADTAIPYVGR